MTDIQRVTWTAFAILPMFMLHIFDTNHFDMQRFIWNKISSDLILACEQLSCVLSCCVLHQISFHILNKGHFYGSLGALIIIGD